MKSRRASGNDDITADLLKADELSALRWIHQIIIDIWQREEIVED